MTRDNSTESGGSGAGGDDDLGRLERELHRTQAEHDRAEAVLAKARMLFEGLSEDRIRYRKEAENTLLALEESRRKAEMATEARKSREAYHQRAIARYNNAIQGQAIVNSATTFDSSSGYEPNTEVQRCVRRLRHCADQFLDAITQERETSARKLQLAKDLEDKRIQERETDKHEYKLAKARLLYADTTLQTELHHEVATAEAAFQETQRLRDIALNRYKKYRRAE